MSEGGGFIPYYTCPNEGDVTLPGITFHDFIPPSLLPSLPPSLPPFLALLDLSDISKRGILELDNSGKVKNFFEKPQPHQTTSRKAVSHLL